MDYKVLYRKYRPTNFDEVIGQDYTITMLKNAFLNDKLAHAFIFTGPRGTGKTSSAKLLAKLVNCENPIDGKPCNCCTSCLNINDNPDVIEIDAASNTGVDNIREIISNVKIAPSFSKYKVYIIDEVHMLSQSAFNALLLTLEEPPKNIIFILATTEIQSVPITILSRCQRFDFNKITQETIFNQLKKVVMLENIDITDEALNEISFICDGGMRDAYSILDQVSKKEEKITVDDIYRNFGIISNTKIENLINSIEKNEIDSIINLINEFKQSSINYLSIVNKLIFVLNNKAKNVKLGKSIGDFDLYKNIIMDLIKLYNIKNVENPYLILEITLLNYCKNDTNYFPGNNFDEKNEQINQKNDDFIEKNVDNIQNVVDNKKNSNDQLDNDFVENDNLFINIRVNNTLVNVNKKYKTEMIEQMNDFIDKADNFIKNMLCDANVAMASDQYVVLSVDKDSTVDIINSNYKKIEEEFFKYCNKNIKFICVSNNKCKQIMDDYIKNKNKKYEYIEENNDDASNSIFDASIVEII